MRRALAAKAIRQALRLLDNGSCVAFLAQRQKPEATEERPICRLIVTAGFDMHVEETLAGGEDVLIAVQHAGRPEQPFEVFRVERRDLVGRPQQLECVRPCPLSIGVAGPFEQRGGIGFHRQSIASPDNGQKNGNRHPGHFDVNSNRAEAHAGTMPAVSKHTVLLI